MAPVRTTERKSTSQACRVFLINRHIRAVRRVHGPWPQRGHSCHPRGAVGWGGDKARLQRGWGGHGGRGSGAQQKLSLAPSSPSAAHPLQSLRDSRRSQE